MDYTASVRSFVVANFLFGDPGTLRDDTALFEEGIVDSTGILELVTFVETTFNLKIENAELLPENFGSIERIARLVVRKQTGIVEPTDAIRRAAAETRTNG